jgi:hypothetical protein
MQLGKGRIIVSGIDFSSGQGRIVDEQRWRAGDAA